jgi:hypothetical protein
MKGRGRLEVMIRHRDQGVQHAFRRMYSLTVSSDRKGLKRVPEEKLCSP